MTAWRLHSSFEVLSGDTFDEYHRPGLQGSHLKKMAAEPHITSRSSQQHLSLVALYDREEDASELLDRLAALSVDTSEATIVRVDNRPVSAAGRRAKAGTLSPVTRSMLSFGIIGGALGVMIGVVGYEIGLLSLAFSIGLFSPALTSTLAGASIGAGIGAVVGAAREKAARVTAATPKPARAGFLVVIKVPLRLAEQAETIARRLGAKEIIL